MASPQQLALDLGSVPPIFILPTNIPVDDLHDYEDRIYAANGALSYDPKEARVFLAKLSQKRRAAFELRSQGVWTEEDVIARAAGSGSKPDDEPGPSRKRRKLGQGHQERHGGSQSLSSSASSSTSGHMDDESPPVTWPDLTSHILVLKTDYLDACLKHQKLLPYEPHLVFYGKVIPKPDGERSPPQPSRTQPARYVKASPSSSSHAAVSTPSTFRTYQPRRFSQTRTSPTITKAAPPKLHRTTTSEFEAESTPSSSPSKLPPLPDWAKSEHSSYACCRSTPLNPVNATFLKQLSAIKLSRVLTLDEIGVRAYSTSIASISAYPYLISSEAEIVRLPGCNNRIAELWREWHDSADKDNDRYIQHVKDLESDPDFKVLRLFYDIWGVGADTARKFLYAHGFKELDDLVEYHWSQLTRVQQLGVKFYSEFLIPVPREETEFIANTIHRHARKAANIPEEAHGTDRDIELVVVGGYRRGKPESGDVDVIVSHRDVSVTKDLVLSIVQSLEEEGWITHTLTMQTTTSDRDQQTLPYRGGARTHGFDSLDKALCVWQDLNYTEPNEHGKNPNIHRRVDIILSPWRTVGCAVLGWSGGTTFQRDLRRFASKQKGWKFDSSGIRDRGSGAVVDLERPVQGKDEADGWEDRERRVMDGLGVGWRPASERCTG